MYGTGCVTANSLVWLHATIYYMQGPFSGIFCLFSATLVASHYTLHNISEPAQITTNTGFRTLAWLSEAIIFFYLGTEILLVPFDGWDFGFIFLVTLLGFIGRAGICAMLSAMLNLTAGPMCGNSFVRPQIGARSQIVLSLAGLRGGTAFALALRWDNDVDRIGPIESLTMGVILLTLCGAGSCVGGIIGCLGLQDDGSGGRGASY